MRRFYLPLVALLAAAPLQAAGPGQVLVDVGDGQVTASDLEQAIASSPFATQLNTLDEPEQAALRGDMLRRLVVAHLLTLEAQRVGLDRSAAFRRELEDHRASLLYRGFLDRLREDIVIPGDVLAGMRQRASGDHESLAAAEAAYRSERYGELRRKTLDELIQRYHVRRHDDRIAPGLSPDTVLLEGDGVRVRYGDLAGADGLPETFSAAWVRERLQDRVELALLSTAAEAQGLDVSARLDAYRAERLPAMLLEQKEREWVRDEQTLADYFAAHPALGEVSERRHVGQLVVADRELAESLRARILKGESLFALAGRYSIDPYGRAHDGDMGWMRAGVGASQLEQAVSKLKDGEVSAVIESPYGFHLVTVLERIPGSHQPFAAARDRVRQALLAERLKDYTRTLEQRFPVAWRVPDHKGRE